VHKGPSPSRGERSGEVDIESKAKALAAAQAAYSKKGQNLTIINIGDESSYADYLVIVSAYSDRQTGAIADAVVEELKTEHGIRPLVREGQGAWVLVDYGDLVVHVFHEDARAFYDLDRLWAKAPRVPVPAFEPALATVGARTH
jgi:ribosome-associated protein